MRVGIIHDSLNYIGGAERVCIGAIEALKDLGHNVVLGTIEPTNWQLLKNAFGHVRMPDKEKNLLPVRTRFRIYSSLLSPWVLSRIKEDCDISVCTAGELMLLGADWSYMHFVPIAFVPERTRHEYSRLVEVYDFPYRLLQPRLVCRLNKDGLIANSHFTNRLIQEQLGLPSYVVHPPATVEEFSPLSQKRADRIGVVSSGRFSPEKNFEFVLALAGRMPETPFVIAGTLSGALSRSYHQRLLRRKESLGLRNVEIIAGSFEKLREIYASSSVFLNTTEYESYGISIVEAMASGLVPIVHRSGGPWEDILDRSEGIYGFAYCSEEEAARAVNKILHSRDEREHILERNRRRIKQFSSSAFKDNLVARIQGIEKEPSHGEFGIGRRIE
jgi:glycosyltransferase involved in cell wall biosynthesis